MAYNISNEYKQIIYSGDARNKLKILFNNVELEDADRYCEKLTIKSRIIPNGAKIFNLNNFISKEADLILHDIDTSIIQNQVSISIGTLVGNSYEYVPIGIFNIENQPTNDKDKTTIKLRDNSVKFDFNYNAQPLIEQNGGVATKLQILQDICSQAGVTCNITSFVGYLDEIGVYDNTITAREYISRIAEQAGRIATINRSGELIFVDLNNLTTWEIPIEVVEKYENGTKFKIGRVVYEDGIIRYETPTSNDDTLFLDGSNNYINGELVKEQASSNNNTYYLQDSGDSELAYLELEGKTTQETRSGINLLNITATTTTQDGITYTVNKDKSITINGTNTKSSTSWLRLAPNFNLPAGTYTLSNGNPNVAYNTFLFYDDKGNIPASGNVSSKTFTSSIEVAPYIRIGGGKTISNQTIYPMIVEGSYTAQTLPTYEPYGAMPSPDYPSELVSVGYENLLNTIYEQGNTNSSSNTTRIRLKTPIKIKKGKSYILSYFGTKTNIQYVINTNQSNNYGWSSYDYCGNNTSWRTAYNYDISFTSTNDGYLSVVLKYTNDSAITPNDDIDFNNFQLIEGTQQRSLIPYGKYGIEVKTQGENLKNKTTWTSGYLNNSNQVVSNNDWKYSDYIDISNGNYIYTSTGTGNLPKTVLYNENKEPIVYLDILARTIDLSLYNATYIRISVANGVFNGLVIKKINTYLYTLDNPLRSIGDTKDLLYIKNGMLYVDRKIGSVVLNGSENWTRQNDNRFWLVRGYWNNATVPKNPVGSEIQGLYCNRFQEVTMYQTWNGVEGISYDNENTTEEPIGSTFDISCNLIAATIEEFVNWLSNNNVEVEYLLQNPKTEELGQVDMPSTYNDITYIDILSNINTNSYIQYRQNKTQLEAILQNTNQFSIDSLKTGKILGNPAIDSYDLIQITDGNKIFKTLATNDLVYTGVLINTFDTQIGEEAKEQNVFINGEETFKKWARTTIDNVEGTLTLQAGQIDEANGKINETNLIIEKDGALLNVLANNSNIDVQYDSEGNPLSGEVREVTTTTGFKFNAEGMTIEDSSSNFKALHRNTGTYYKDGDTIVGQYTKDGSKQKDLELFGVYYYGKNDFPDTPMFIAQLYTDENGEEAFGHFYNRGD